MIQRHALGLATLSALLTFAAVASAQAPMQMPVQGVLADAAGKPIQDRLTVIFTLYKDAEGTEALWVESQEVAFEDGFFTVYLGADTDLEPALFRDNPTVFLGVAFDGDEEMDTIPLATAPFAAYAQHAGDAATLGGQGPEAFAAADHTHQLDWADLQNIPEDLLDGDADTVWELADGGGLALTGNALSLITCAEGEVIKQSQAGWGCAPDSSGQEGNPNDELNQAAQLIDGILEITDAGGTLEVDLTGLQDGTEDADADPENELITAVTLDGTNLTITDGGRSLTVDLAALVADDDDDPANERNTNVELDGTNLRITDSGGTLTASLASLVDDDDADPTNERNTNIELDGVNLRITDSGGTLTTNLATLVNDLDADPTNERNTNVELDGTNLRITDSGGTLSANLATLVNDLDADPTNEYVRNAFLSGPNLRIVDGGGTRSVNLSALIEDDDADPTNEYNTSVSLNGTQLRIADGAGVKAVDLVSLIDDADSDPNNERQSLTLSESMQLGISDGNTVELEGRAYHLQANMAHSPDDISGFTTLQGDDAFANVALPFSVVVAGTTYNSVHISTNGWLHFGTSTLTDLSNDCLPSQTHTRPLVAFYWDDLITNGNHFRYGTVGDSPNQVFIVDFEARTFSGAHSIRGQVQIHEGSGLINVKYRDMAQGATGQNATIGFQLSRTKAYAVTCNGKVLDDNQPGEGWSVSPLR